MLKTKKPNLSDLQAFMVNPAPHGTLLIELPRNINSFFLKLKRTQPFGILSKSLEILQAISACCPL